MKFIKQIAAVGTGIAMLGATMTGALAADLGTLPEPFVASDAYVNVAMVIGAGSDDADARSTIQTYMNGLATATTVSGDGDSYKFEKTSNIMFYITYFYTCFIVYNVQLELAWVSTLNKSMPVSKTWSISLSNLRQQISK